MNVAMRDLSICPLCACSLVYPVDWEEASVTHWEVTLRCPNCEWGEVGVFDEATVDKFDDTLDAATDLIVRRLHLLEATNLARETERFAAALAADAILPEDF